MDLNVSLVPEEDEAIYRQRVVEETAGHEHEETAVRSLYREGDGRQQELKRKFPGEGIVHVSPSFRDDQRFKFNNRGSYNENTLPHGWLHCPPHGHEIGCIIPSKVPLSESFDKYISGERYSPKHVIHKHRLLGKELGLVIDLTNTNRYYPVSAWSKEGIRHVKIRCKGRDSVPDDASVDNFVSEVLRFCSEKTHPKKYVLVHCTHGHNRTGYMIVHFLKRTESISVTEAIDKFAMARPPGIYKQDYIDALYMFYHEKKPEQVVCPRTPEWKRSPDLESTAEDKVHQEHGNGALLHVCAPDNHVRDAGLTNDDVLGEAIPPDQLRAFRQDCYHVLKLGAPLRGNLHFPGSHPVSLNSENLQLLRQCYYYATWKADGTRYMMLITRDGCYLIDRNFYFRRVQMRFPCKYPSKGTPEKTHHYTLLDGEMIIDTDPRTKKQERRYLIYDLMAINGISVAELPFHERWKTLDRELIEPRNMERETLSKSIYPYYRYDLEPFGVRRKGFWLLSTVNKLLRNFIPQLSHESDGLIFQGWDDPYVPRTHEGLLKWKFGHMNSVDFLYEQLGANNCELLFLYERGRKKLMDGNRVTFGEESDSSQYSGKIIECSWDPNGNIWVFMRVRVDKSSPNEFNTYRKVMRSIRDNITADVLLKEIDEIIRLPMYADRIENDIKAHQTMARRR
ncbi:mRNA-capping enzyme-like isoform X3 [Tripterygium wilfordii]|uniref:mRNA-capping enzyme-like isoform X3 n=1 Tax=Tripterygium wilfordii TaxID=458696 RepID=UPI0018F8143F|nr:mRNA-capping enzyme-like isoform X3 [Tripterygium wilfordii]